MIYESPAALWTEAARIHIYILALVEVRQTCHLWPLRENGVTFSSVSLQAGQKKKSKTGFPF